MAWVEVYGGQRSLAFELMMIEKRSRYVAMVAKFLDDNKPKTSLKKQICAASNFIYFNLSDVGELFWNPKAARAREIRKIHVAVVKRRLRNVQKKSVMHVQSC